jgi:hypothetical protein
MANRLSGSGQRMSEDQANDVLQALLQRASIDQQNILMDKEAYANMFPTEENKAAVTDNAIKMEKYLQDKGAKLKEDVYSGAGLTINELKTPTIRVGSIGGADIYGGGKTGGEYILTPGTKETPTSKTGQTLLSDVTNIIQAASKTGEYNLFKMPGETGSRQLDAMSISAKQWLGENLPGYKETSTTKSDLISRFGEDKITSLTKLGSITINGTSLPIVSRPGEGREFVKTPSGEEVPLKIMTEARDLATGGGIYASNPDLRNATLDYIAAYRLANVATTGENLGKYRESEKNLANTPGYRPEMFSTISAMTTIGGKYAGLKQDDVDSKWVPESDNIAQSLLRFSSSSPTVNAVKAGIIGSNDADRPFIRDTLNKVSSYGGDPLVALQILKYMGNQDKDIFNLDPRMSGYSEAIDAIARSAAGPNSKENYQLSENVKSSIQTHQKLFPTDRDTGSSNWNLKPIDSEFISVVNTEVKNPTKVTNLSKVYINPGSMKKWNKQGSAGNVPTSSNLGIPHITPLVMRKSKSSKPKINIKKEKIKNPIKDMKVSINMEKILGNVTGMLELPSNSKSAIKDITLKPISNFLLSMGKKGKVNKHGR